MFIAAHYTIAKTWMQPKCPSTEDIYDGTLAMKKNKIVPFAATWMQLEILILRKSERERQILYDITYMWNLEYGTDEPIYKTETDSDIENRLLPGGRGEEWDRLGVWG